MWVYQKEVNCRLPALDETFNEMRARVTEQAILLSRQEIEKAEQEREMEALRSEVDSLRLIASTAEAQKIEFQRRLQEFERRSSEEFKRLKAQREEDVRQRDLSAAQAADLKAELKDYKEGESVRWEQKKQELLASDEIRSLVEDRAAPLLRFGFVGAIRQMKAGVSLDKMDLKKVVDELPDDTL